MTPALAAVLFAPQINLLGASNEFTDPRWTKNGGQTIVPHAATGPDGTLSGSSNTSSSADPQLYQMIPAKPNTTYTGFVSLWVPSGTLATKIVFTDQDGLAVGSAVNVGLTTTPQTFSVTATTGAAISGLRFAIGGFGTLPSTTVYDIAFAQVNYGATARTYQPRN